MKKQFMKIGVLVLLCVGLFTVNISGNNLQIKVNEVCSLNTIAKDCNNLSKDQRKNMERGYNELSSEDKKTLEKYRGQYRPLNKDELEEYYNILDKMYKYMDEEFKTQARERREQRINKSNTSGCIK